MAQSSYVDPSKAFLGPFQNPSRILLGLVLPKTKYRLFCFSNKGKYIISFCLFYFHFLKTNGISFVQPQPNSIQNKNNPIGCGTAPDNLVLVFLGLVLF